MNTNKKYQSDMYSLRTNDVFAFNVAFISEPRKSCINFVTPLLFVTISSPVSLSSIGKLSLKIHEIKQLTRITLKINSDAIVGK
jgi:hypothetical protein